MSRPITPADSLQARFSSSASSALDPVSTSAEVMRQRSSSTSSKDTRARDLLDSSVGERSERAYRMLPVLPATVNTWLLTCTHCCNATRSCPCTGLATDPKTRKEWAKFTQLVDRTLQSFESVSEWADFITFLGKLLKVRTALIAGDCERGYR